jgi:AsmA protein
MPRRVVFLIALISLVILGAAAAPWTLTGSGLSSSVTEHLRNRYGLDFKVEGRSTLALLPIPRVKFENVALSFPDQAARADGGTLRGELRLLPLLFGRIELAEVALNDTKITASYRKLRSLDWPGILKDRAEEPYARRLIVVASSLQWTDVKDGTLDKIHAVVSWAGPGEPLHAVGSALWRDERIALEQASFQPEALASNRLSPVTLTISAPSGSIALTGEAQLGDDPRITGESLIKATSVRDFTRWSGVDLPFGSLIQAMSIKGDVSLNRRRLSWPSVAVSLGADQLEGTMSVRFDVERPLIAGTLAADSLNLSDFFSPLVQARNASGAWSEDAIDLARTTGNDLDLRLSAATASLGRLQLDDMAANVLVRPGRIEASIGRAVFHEGTLKGRLSLATLDGSADFKGQGTFDGVDLHAFLNAIGERRWITGRAQGQFLLEGKGRSPADVIRQAHGRSSVTVKEGELVGIALNDAIRRVEKRPLLASLNWKGGRTSFDQAQAQLTLKDGIGEIAEGRLSAPALLTSLHGQVSLVDRTLRLKADVSPLAPNTSPSPVIVFDVSGGWDSVVITPDARALIERSGAAKPLFGPQLLP